MTLLFERGRSQQNRVASHLFWRLPLYESVEMLFERCLRVLCFSVVWEKRETKAFKESGPDFDTAIRNYSAIKMPRSEDKRTEKPLRRQSIQTRHDN